MNPEPRKGGMMFRIMLTSKIHRAVVTDANLDYEGSLTLDEELLQAAELLPYQQVQVYNISNGERFETYLIPGPCGSGTVCVNGAAARLVQVGDLLIIASYKLVHEEEAAGIKPRIVLVDGKNRITSQG